MTASASTPVVGAPAGGGQDQNQNLVPITDLDFHKHQKKCCGGSCPFSGPKLGSKGNERAPIVVVLDQPTSVEAIKQKPFDGSVQTLLNEIFPKGSRDEDILYLYAMECVSYKPQQTDGNYNKGIRSCHNHFINKIQAHPRRIIIALGALALQALTGDNKLKITQIRGWRIASPLATCGIMPVLHPASMVYGTGSYRQWRLDVQNAYELGIGGSPTPYVEAGFAIVPEDADRDTVLTYMDHILENADVANELTGDLETSSLDYITAQILCFGICSNTRRGYLFFERHIPWLKGYIESKLIKWAWHNGQFDIKLLRYRGINARVDSDTILLSYTFDENGGVHDLDQCALDHLGAPPHKHMIKPWLPNKKTSYAAVPRPILMHYAAIDIAKTHGLRRKFERLLNRDKILSKLYNNILIPATDLLAWVEMNGFYVDLERVNENAAKYTKLKQELRADIEKLYGKPINPGSWQQVAILLYDHYKFPDKNNRSTDKKTIDALYEYSQHPILDKLRQYRKANKLYGTYIKALYKHTHPHDGRVHATFKLYRTKTGRLASSDPNLQNQPRLAEIRGQFIAAPGHELVEVDLSQAELRVLAVISKDPLLLRVYENDLDLHTDLANFLFPGWDERNALGEAGNKEMKALTKEQRTKCKNVNFGIIYGITPFGLFDQIGGSLSECRDLIDGWARRYAVAWAFIQKCRATPLANQTLITCFGRMKRVGVVSAANLPFLQNEAANFFEQSIASDITLTAAIRVMPEYKRVGLKIVNLIHDAILTEVPITPDNHLRHKAITLCQDALMQVPRDYGLTQIPFKTEAEVGTRWGFLNKGHMNNEGIFEFKTGE